jgi:hypothetical protein
MLVNYMNIRLSVIYFINVKKKRQGKATPVTGPGSP